MKSRHKGRHFFRYMSISEAKLPTQSAPFRIFYQYFNEFSYFSTEIQTAFLNRGIVPLSKKFGDWYAHFLLSPETTVSPLILQNTPFSASRHKLDLEMKSLQPCYPKYHS